MNLWKVIATTLIVSMAFAFLLQFAPPAQKQMLMCAIVPNCVYVVGAGITTVDKEQ
ncbi:hypothetical protein P3W70_07210 [Achromobacter denitrificans]|uniref:hypothetical protein n=1 Tax=Achromobacter denitrificans TaxID=32002 RepID=UPI0023E8B4EC|nr:hypothetical protein [Achromobacter denitrificans]MDF3858127.1 hypothetical protein [Achromobacter denitrificans]